MAGAYSQVDLAQLPAPDVVETLDYEVILARMLARVRALYPDFTALVESDPAYKILEAAAWEVMLERQRVNDAAHGIMIAYAKGADLDQIAARYGVSRLLIVPADDSAIPPTPAVYEADDDLRARTVLSLEGYTSAGSEGSYVFHALSASGEVKDVSAVSPEPGQVVVYVLSREGTGTASLDLIGKVTAALNGSKVRPLTDQVTVLSAAIQTYAITAELVVYPGPDSSVVRAAAEAAAATYAERQRKMGYDVTLSGIYAALHQPGVQRVNLTSPPANITIDEGEASYCTGITVTTAEAPDV